MLKELGLGIAQILLIVGPAAPVAAVPTTDTMFADKPMLQNALRDDPPVPESNEQPVPKVIVPAGGVKRSEAITGPQTRDAGVWARLARCESGMRNLRGKFSGYFQFAPATWRGMGEAGVAADYSYDYQLRVAIRLQARYGWGQWPACSRQLGLR